MGNCLKGSSADDISLLRGAENPVDSSSTDQLGPPPPYRADSRTAPLHSFPTLSLPCPSDSAAPEARVCRKRADSPPPSPVPSLSISYPTSSMLSSQSDLDIEPELTDLETLSQSSFSTSSLSSPQSPPKAAVQADARKASEPSFPTHSLPCPRQSPPKAGVRADSPPPSPVPSLSISYPTSSMLSSQSDLDIEPELADVVTAFPANFPTPSLSSPQSYPRAVRADSPPPPPIPSLKRPSTHSLPSLPEVDFESELPDAEIAPPPSFPTNSLPCPGAPPIIVTRADSPPLPPIPSFTRFLSPPLPPLPEVDFESELEALPVYYPSPNISRPVTQLTEEEQVKIAKRLGLIQHLPTGTYDGCKKSRECVICMVELVVGDNVRYLPCMHTYHVKCIDDWLMRSFTCPSCMEPVDAALLTTYETR